MEIQLKPIVMYDLPQIQKWLSDDEVNRYLVTKRPTLNDCKRYWLSCQRLNRDYLAINADNVFIGTCTIEYNYDNNYAVMGMMIGEKKYWGKGIGAKVIEIIKRKVIDAGIECLKLGVAEDNVKALKLYNKCGFIITETKMELKL